VIRIVLSNDDSDELLLGLFSDRVVFEPADDGVRIIDTSTGDQIAVMRFPNPGWVGKWKPAGKMRFYERLSIEEIS
jgi:hypothetical protein